MCDWVVGVLYSAVWAMASSEVKTAMVCYSLYTGRRAKEV